MTTIEEFARASPSRTPELMDDPACDAGRLDRALDALATINRWFGGTAAPAHRVGARRLDAG